MKNIVCLFLEYIMRWLSNPLHHAYNPGHCWAPLPPFNVGSDCTVFCVTVNIERGDGG